MKLYFIGPVLSVGSVATSDLAQGYQPKSFLGITHLLLQQLLFINVNKNSGCWGPLFVFVVLHSFPLFLISPETIQIWVSLKRQFLAIESQNSSIIKSVFVLLWTSLGMVWCLFKRFVSQLQHTLHSVPFHLLFCATPKYWGFIPVSLFQISYYCT